MDILGSVNTEKLAVQNISQLLFQAEVQLHILHLQAVRRQLEIHLAIGELYSALGDLNDDLVEKSYPKVGLLEKYSDIPIKNLVEPLPFVQGLMAAVEKQRGAIKTGYIQQLVDNCIEPIAHCIYKLINLQ